MPELQPPAFAQAGEYDAANVRRAVAANVRDGGIIATGDLGVNARSPASMTLDVTAGEAMILGTQVDRQGAYHVTAQGTTPITLDPSSSTNPRIDTVVARVYDEQYAGSVTEWKLEAVKGTAAPSPVPPSLPPNSLPLVDVTVAAGASSIPQSAISNRRRFASFASERYTTRNPHRGTGVVGSVPTTLYGFLTVARTQLVTTNGQGEATITYPTPAGDAGIPELFPNGVLTVVASPGFASPPFVVNVNHGGHTRTSFVIRAYRLDGERLTNETIRVNYVAVGW